MSILNVVQPDELDGSTFAVTGGKVKAAISAMPDNLLQSKSDGLFASGGGVGIPNRYIYNIKPGEYLEHKGIKFDLYMTDGAVGGHVYGDRIADNGMVNFHDQDYYYSADGSISLPWGVERYPRFTIRVNSLTGEPTRDIFVVRVLMSSANDYLISVIIDEMITAIHPGDGDGDSGDGIDEIVAIAYASTGVSPNTAGTGIIIGGVESSPDTIHGFALDEEYQLTTNKLFSLKTQRTSEWPPFVVDDLTSNVLSQQPNGLLSLYVSGFNQKYTDIFPSVVHDGNIRLQLATISTASNDPLFGFSTLSDGTLYYGFIGLNDEGFEALIGPLVIEPTLEPTDTFLSSILTGKYYNVYFRRNGLAHLMQYTLDRDTHVAGEPIITQVGPIGPGVTAVDVFNLGFNLCAVQYIYSEADCVWQVMGDNPLDDGASNVSTDLLESTALVPMIGKSPNTFVTDVTTYNVSALMIDNVNQSFALVTFNLLSQDFRIDSAPVAMEYMALLMQGVTAWPFWIGGMLGYQERGIGNPIKLIDLEVGGVTDTTLLAGSLDSPHGHTVFTMSQTQEFKAVTLNENGMLGQTNLIQGEPISVNSNIIPAFHNGIDGVVLNTMGEEALLLLRNDQGEFESILLDTMLADEYSEHLKPAIGGAGMINVAYLDKSNGSIYYYGIDSAVKEVVTRKTYVLDTLIENFANDNLEYLDYVKFGISDNYAIVTLPQRRIDDVIYPRGLLVVDLLTGESRLTDLDAAGIYDPLENNVIGLYDDVFVVRTTLDWSKSSVAATRFQMFRISNDLSIEEVVTLHTPRVDSFENLDPEPVIFGNNAEVHIPYLSSTGYGLGYFDLQADPINGTLGLERYVPGSSVLTSSLFNLDGLPTMATFGLNEDRTQLSTLNVQSTFILAFLNRFDTYFEPYLAQDLDGVVKEVAAVVGSKAVVFDKVDDTYHLFDASFYPRSKISVAAVAEPWAMVNNLNRHIAYCRKRNMLSYIDTSGELFVKVLSDGADAFAEENVTVIVHEHEWETSELVMGPFGADKTLTLCMRYGTTDTELSNTNIYMFTTDHSANHTIGTVHLLNTEAVPRGSGVAIIDRGYLVKVHSETSDVKIRLNPVAGGLVYSYELPVSGSLKKLIQMGENYFAAIVDDSSITWLYIFEMTDNGPVQLDYWNITGEFYLGGAGGPNSAFRKLLNGDYRAPFAARDEEGVATVGSVRFDPTGGSVIQHQILDASVPHDKISELYLDLHTSTGDLLYYLFQPDPNGDGVGAYHNA